MTPPLYRKELLAGLAALAIGIAVSIVSLDYRIGTPARMGPGLVPLALGIILSVSGLFAVLLGLRSVETAPPLRPRPMIAITAALLAFAFAIERLGFMPASVLLIFISGLSENPPKWAALLVLSGVLAPAAYLLFVVLLGIPAPAFTWNP